MKAWTSSSSSFATLWFQASKELDDAVQGLGIVVIMSGWDSDSWFKRFPGLYWGLVYIYCAMKVLSMLRSFHFAYEHHQMEKQKKTDAARESKAGQSNDQVGSAA
jgi:hypothetical protein